jgi:hypothetical protein
MIELLWTSDQPVAEASTYTGQHSRQTSMSSAELKPATPVTKRPQTYASDRAATGIGKIIYTLLKFKFYNKANFIAYIYQAKGLPKIYFILRSYFVQNKYVPHTKN